MSARLAALAVAIAVAAWSFAPVGPAVECDDHDDAPSVAAQAPTSSRIANARLQDDCCKVGPAARRPLATTPKQFAFTADALAPRSRTIADAYSPRTSGARIGPLDGRPPPLERVLPLLD